ncbi:FGGY family carbohydrate kinase [Phaeovulum sp. W22_SRMD_FR3]|uniref:FGGY family carbohydrate kinase n=1 Tax=Phaeovulum sp. W22_SRMD_FR3 TaxID=3240274 RepID=UPI003F977DB4
MKLLALDQGTTSTRAVLLTPDGRAEVLASLTHRQLYPQPGWVEHDPQELLSHLRACLAAGISAGAGAVGLANQGESCLGWDAESGVPVGPVIVWQDSRTADVIAEMAAAGLGPEVMARAGLPLDAYFSAAKLGWILRHNPAAAALAARGRLCLGTTDAWFRWQLTGRFETDVTTAARTSLMNLATCEWDPELCRIFDVPLQALPRITASSGDLGALAPGLPLAASLTDQQAALFGHGCRAPGDAKVTFGTGAFALAVTEKPLAPCEGPLQTLAWQRAGQAPVYALDAGVTTAAAAVNWARDLGLFKTFSEINQFEAPAAIGRGLVFVPALAGLGCPHWDRSARGGWLGMTLATAPRDLMQALLEGVALRMAEALAAIAAVQPLTGPISVDGGMAANGYMMQFLADCSGHALVLSDQNERTAIGVALMAGEVTGEVPPVQEVTRRIDPQRDGRVWRARFAQARGLIQRWGADLEPAVQSGV